jgi:hypothetical protein
MFQSYDENSFINLADVSSMASRGCIPHLPTFISSICGCGNI